jgi:hypothetical protein
MPLKYLPSDALRNFTWKTALGSTRPMVPPGLGGGEAGDAGDGDGFAGGDFAASIVDISTALLEVARIPRITMQSILNDCIFPQLLDLIFQMRCRCQGIPTDLLQNRL